MSDKIDTIIVRTVEKRLLPETRRCQGLIKHQTTQTLYCDYQKIMEIHLQHII